jgi:hypothetical protein
VTKKNSRQEKKMAYRRRKQQQRYSDSDDDYEERVYGDDYGDYSTTWSEDEYDASEEISCMRLLKSARILTFEEENRVLHWISDNPDCIVDAKLGLFETVVHTRLRAWGEKEVPCVINGREISGADRVDEMVLSVGMAREAFRLVNPRTGDTMLHCALSRPVMHFQIVDVIMRADPRAASVANMRNWTPMLEMMFKARIAGPDFYSLFAAVAPESFEVSANHARWNGQSLVSAVAGGYSYCPRIMKHIIDASRPEDFIQRGGYTPSAVYNAVGRLKEGILTESAELHAGMNLDSGKIAGRMEIVRMIARAHPEALACEHFGSTPLKHMLAGGMNGIAGFGFISERYYALACELIDLNPRGADGSKYAGGPAAVSAYPVAPCAFRVLLNNLPTVPRVAEHITALILAHLPHLIEDNDWLIALTDRLNPAVLRTEIVAAAAHVAPHRRIDAMLMWGRARMLARKRYAEYVAASA